MKIVSTACIVNAAVIIVIFATLMIAEYRADLSAESLNVSKIMRLRHNINAVAALYNKRGTTYKNNKNKCVMEKKKYLVYLNDEVTEPIVVFSADTVSECKDWIEKQLEGLTPVDDEHPCTDDIMYSSHTFYYEVYEGDMIVETNGVAEYNDLCYASDYYYRD